MRRNIDISNHPEFKDEFDTLFRQVREQLPVVALIPQRYRSLLRPGQGARLELVGFGPAGRNLQVERVGRDTTEAGPGDGPMVMVTAAIPDAHFRVNGEVHAFRDGMHGTLAIRIRSKPALAALLPRLRSSLEPRRD